MHPVLEAVLAEPDVRAADLVVACGDLAAGPLPGPTLDALTALGERLVLVRGNADRELVDVARGGASSHAETHWAATQLRPDHVDLLASLAHPVRLKVAGFGPVVFCHGTPSSDSDVVLVDSPSAVWVEALAGLPDEVRTVVCGHTHTPFVRFVGGRMVVNAGSIGMPYSRPGGAWLLLRDGQVSLRHTPIDVDSVCARIVRESTYPDRQAWVDEYVRAVNSDLDALAAFTPMVARPSGQPSTA